MKKLFFDTEFTGLRKSTTLISIAVIGEEVGQSFYAELTDYDVAQVDPWIQENVIDNLKLSDFPENFPLSSLKTTMIKGTKEHIKEAFCLWLADNFGDEQIEMWSDCLAYDWVLFVDLFGDAFDLPKQIYYIPFDICPLFKESGIDPDVNRELFCDIDEGMAGTKHNAYWDALVIKECYLKLQGYLS